VTRGVLLLLLVLAVSCIGPRYPELPRAEVAAYPTNQYQLPNRLRVVLERGPDFGRAGAVLIVGAGSSADPAGFRCGTGTGRSSLSTVSRSGCSRPSSVRCSRLRSAAAPTGSWACWATRLGSRRRGLKQPAGKPSPLRHHADPWSAMLDLRHPSLARAGRAPDFAAPRTRRA
jgi:hypothetical protein